jgi:hypothetical protein
VSRMASVVEEEEAAAAASEEKYSREDSSSGWKTTRAMSEPAGTPLRTKMMEISHADKEPSM